MRLHKNTELFKEAIKITAERLGIKDIYLEKDYWVTFALRTIFTNKIGGSVIFKGGTSLVKCFGLIERFSEDIDLTVLRYENDTDHQLKKKLKQITIVIANNLPEIQLDGITNKMGMIRKTAHTYPHFLKGDFGQVRDTIIIESSWLGSFEPHTTAEVSSYIYDMMIGTEQNELIQEYNLLPFLVKVLDPKRTLCEKIMSLVRFSHAENPIITLNNKIRHVYDIHKILENEELTTFFNADEFEKMLLKVANDDVVSFKNDNHWLKYHPKDALLFAEPVQTWNQLEQTYQSSFKAMVYGELPNEADILNTLKLIAKRLENLEWNINI
ncbi:MAG: nucleotidyl transferase AbiEii/AbiGii toxin family protein [Flavobacteriaceae bacterium]|nr:MAG: nucleotidyl transferase AbiEii/AbiGii toxin family protein [Flavobacteriaceae bacterium]